MKVRLNPWPAGWTGRATLTVCVNERKEEFVQSCGRRGALDILARLRSEVDARGLELDIQTIACLGLCAKGPNARLAPANSWFHQVSADDVAELVDLLSQELSRIDQSVMPHPAPQPTP